jgi:O-antigen ligase
VTAARPSRLLAWLVALLAGCPVLINLAATYISDGESFSLIVGASLVVLALLGVVACRHGLAAPRSLPTAAFAVLALVFWLHYLVLTLALPSRADEGLMRLLPAYAVLWIAAPLMLVLATRHALDSRQVLTAVLALLALFAVLGLLRFAFGLGRYHAGRWSPGESLDAIRLGRYAAAGVLVAVVALIAAPAGRRDRLLAALVLGPAAFLLVVANARGPWLALLAALLCAAPALAVVLVRRARADLRVLAAGLAAVLALGVAVLSAARGSQANLDRLFDPTQDGGSADGRASLLHDYAALFAHQPWGLATGYGYDHTLFYPHNLLVEALSVGGVPALALLLALIVLVLARGLRPAWRGDGPAIAFLGLFVLGLVGAQFSGSLANELMPWFAGALVLVRAEEVAGVPVLERT